MANPADLHTALLERLRTLTTLRVFDGDVPTSPPAEPATGRVYPYAVAWGSPGYTPEEARGLDADADGGLAWPVQVTVAAGDLTWCLHAVHLVRTALDGHVLAPGAGVLVEDEGTPGVQPDRDTTPLRWFVPLTFRSLNA